MVEKEESGVSAEEFIDAQATAVVNKIAEAQGGDYGYPEAPVKDSVFKFFRDILSRDDSSKVGNLNTKELGELRLAVRHYQDLARYAETEGLDEVKKYLMRKGEIILATSSSKKGFLSQLFVTQIKKEQKVQPKQEKSGWFGGKKVDEEGGEAT